ncbi:unnamed protein product, partial [marine sediment metagenome]
MVEIKNNKDHKIFKEIKKAIELDDLPEEEKENIRQLLKNLKFQLEVIR